VNRGRLLARALFGGGLDRRVAPIVPVSFTYSASFSTFWVYVGIYAVKGLHWPASRVGLLFLASAPAAAVANYLSGRISDRTGRKPLIVASFLASSANVLLLTWLGGTTALAFVLIVVQGVIGAPAYSLDRVLVADLVADEESREPAYAAVRVATNLGTLVGPPLGALLVFVAGWTAFLLGIAVLGVVGAAFAITLLPPAHAIVEAHHRRRRQLVALVGAVGEQRGAGRLGPVVAERDRRRRRPADRAATGVKQHPRSARQHRIAGDQRRLGHGARFP